MKKILVSLFLLITLAVGFAAPYEPMTREQAKNWIAKTPIDTLIDFVIYYDYVEHTAPRVIMPDFMYILTKDGSLYIDAQASILITQGMEPPLSYEIEISSKIIRNFYQPDKGKVLNYLLWGAGGFTVGAAVVLVLSLITG